jgi:hypothetical protein
MTKSGSDKYTDPELRVIYRPSNKQHMLIDFVCRTELRKKSRPVIKVGRALPDVEDT